MTRDLYKHMYTGHTNVPTLHDSRPPLTLRAPNMHHHDPTTARIEASVQNFKISVTALLLLQ